MQLAEDILIEQLKKRLYKPLPGTKAHAAMCPVGRGLERLNGSNPRKSAVLILLYCLNGILKTTLIKRSEYDGIHSGQLAFPGGKQDAADSSLKETALREAFEEVGVHENDVDILGKLTTLYIPVSNMEVHPFVGFHKSKPIFVRQEKEVQQILSPDFQNFVNHASIKKAIFEGASYKIEAPCYTLNGFKVWGATAMIMSEFVQIYIEATGTSKQ